MRRATFLSVCVALLIWLVPGAVAFAGDRADADPYATYHARERSYRQVDAPRQRARPEYVNARHAAEALAHRRPIGTIRTQTTRIVIDRPTYVRPSLRMPRHDPTHARIVRNPLHADTTRMLVQRSMVLEPLDQPEIDRESRYDRHDVARSYPFDVDRPAPLLRYRRYDHPQRYWRDDGAYGRVGIGFYSGYRGCPPLIYRRPRIHHRPSFGHHRWGHGRFEYRSRFGHLGRFGHARPLGGLHCGVPGLRSGGGVSFYFHFD